MIDVDSVHKIKHHGYRADLVPVNGLAQGAPCRSQSFRPDAIALSIAAKA